MFEKEAFNYGMIYAKTTLLNTNKELEQAYKDGAEFGYNKAKEEMQKQIEKMKCCENCGKKGHICVAEEMQGKLCGKNKDKWELRR